MPDRVNIKLRFFSPRWGQEEVCSFDFEREEATFELRGKMATCSWPEGYDPSWKPDSPDARNPVENILREDRIFPPNIFVDALEGVWKAWRDGNLDAATAQQEIDRLCEWVNESTHHRPRTNFWRMTF